MRQQKNTENMIFGRNAVLEAIAAGTEINCVYLAAGATGNIGYIAAMAKKNGIPVKEVAAQKLDDMAAGIHHQGVAAEASSIRYASVEEIIARAEGQPLFLLVADGIEDPHNLGAIIRTAEAAGVHGLILPKRRSASVGATVFKTSAGACSHLPIARVANLASTIDALKKEGIFFYAAEAGGPSIYRTDLTGNIGIVIGSEGSGVGELIKKKCDGIISLDLYGKVNSLNASVAAGIVMYEAVRQRRSGKSS